MKKKITVGVLLLGLLLLLLLTLAYFSKSDLEGDAYAEVCACGYRRVVLKAGKIVLAEPNHSNRVGFVNGVYGEAGTNVVLYVGGRQVPIATTWNHLGLRYVDPETQCWNEYVVLKPRWKAYVYWVHRRMTIFLRPEGFHRDQH